jgi:hypothetical protein
VENGVVIVAEPGDVRMGYKPPKGVSPPHLDGKRTGRPKGSRNHAAGWADAVWGYDHRDDDAPAPTHSAAVWREFGQIFPGELSDFLLVSGCMGQPRMRRRDIDEYLNRDLYD